MTRRKWIIGIAAFVILLAAIAGIRIFLRLNAYERKVAGTRFSGIEPGMVMDGVYVGEYDVDFISALAELTILDGRLAKMRLLKYHHGRGEAALPLLDEMVDKQSLDVDTITGATNSCVVIRKAAELALESAPPREK